MRHGWANREPMPVGITPVGERLRRMVVVSAVAFEFPPVVLLRPASVPHSAPDD